jgi:hypothetical protein
MDVVRKTVPYGLDIKTDPGLPQLKAFVYVEYCQDSRSNEAQHKADIHLQHLYNPCSIDDLYLWSIINGQGKRLSVFINTPCHFKSPFFDKIVPFAPSDPAYISGIFVRCENLNDFHKNECHDSSSVAGAFGTCLALASYSRGYWGSEDHRKGKDGGILLPDRQTCLYVELASGNLGLKRCMPSVGP